MNKIHYIFKSLRNGYSEVMLDDSVFPVSQSGYSRLPKEHQKLARKATRLAWKTAGLRPFQENRPDAI
jgi:hypothetical protein